MNPIHLTLGENIDKIFYNFDLWAFHLFGSIQNTFLTYVAKFFTTFGDEEFVIPIAIMGIIFCLFKKTRKYGFALIFAIIIGTMVTNIIIKPVALRIRPYNTLQENAQYWAWYLGAGALSESDYSFPSGHTTGATEIAVAIFLCLRKDKKKLAYLFPILALFTAGSRVYLMVHYLTDVIAGLLVGCVAGVLGYLLMLLVIRLIEKSNANEKFDLAIVFKRISSKNKGRLAPIVICIAVLGIFLNAFIPVLTEGGEKTCAYVGEYNCNNAARIDDEKYPAIDGNEYCKIHWKQLMNK